MPQYFRAFFPYIIGAKHAVRKRLESETGTLIQIPKLGQDGDIGNYTLNFLLKYETLFS